MDFLKKHYEKALLGLVLLGLAVAVVFLLFKVGNDKQALEDKSGQLLTPKVPPLTNLDMSVPEQALKRLATPAVFDFGAPNRLLNPMPWQQTPDKRLIRSDKVGPTALVVTNITPLYLRLTLDSVTVSDSGPRYFIGIEKQAIKSKKQAYCTLNPPSKNDTFTMLEVKGKADDPAQVKVVVQLNDTGERAVISTNQPFQRVEAYTADLRYPPENKPPWLARRIGATLAFNGEEYKIVAINQNEVVLAAPNQKKWTIKASATP